MAPISAPGHRALRKGRVSRLGQVYLVTTAVSRRACVFADFRLGAVACRALHQATQAGALDALCWVLMPDHLHLLAGLEGDGLSHAVGNLKARIAAAVNDARGGGGRLWQAGFHDRSVRRDIDLRAIARYVVMNPVRAGLVTSIRGYPFWDAMWL